jgi:hypothetical protein
MSWGFAALVQVSISSDIDLENPELNASDWVKVGETVVDIGYGISCNSEFDLQTVSVIRIISFWFAIDDTVYRIRLLIQLLRVPISRTSDQ